MSAPASIKSLTNDRRRSCGLKVLTPASSARKITEEPEPSIECRKCKGSGTLQLSPRSVQYMQSVLSRALNRAVKWDLVPRNVCKLVSPPRVPRKTVEPLTPEESRQFLDSINGDRNEALYGVAMALGLRKGEALGLRWADIDLEAGVLRVEHALQRFGPRPCKPCNGTGKMINKANEAVECGECKGKGRTKGEGLKLVEPKSDRSHRTLPLPEFAVKALRTHRARQIQERLVAGSDWKETGHVFTTTVGTPMDERKVHCEFKRALSRAGLAPKRFHDLRHTAASLLLAQGVHPRTVMETLGHSQISLTLNTYSHVMPSVLRDAADKMQVILAGNG